MTNTKIVGMLIAAFVAGSCISSPELRAFAADTIRSIDIVDGEVKTADLGSNAVTATKIKDGEVKAAEIATNAVGTEEIATGSVGSDEIGSDSVGASELQGVTQLTFSKCAIPQSKANQEIASGGFIGILCSATNVDADDSVVATLNAVDDCFLLAETRILPDGLIRATMVNNCEFNVAPGPGSIGLIAFDKTAD